MKRSVLLMIVIAVLTMAFSYASGETWIHRDSTGEVFCVDDVTIPGTDILTRLDTCSFDCNTPVAAIKSYVSVVLSVAKAVGKTVLKVMAGFIQSIV